MHGFPGELLLTDTTTTQAYASGFPGHRRLEGYGPQQALSLGLIYLEIRGLLGALTKPAAKISATEPHSMRPYDTALLDHRDRKSTRLNSSHGYISYAVFCLKKKK